LVQTAGLSAYVSKTTQVSKLDLTVAVVTIQREDMIFPNLGQCWLSVYSGVTCVGVPCPVPLHCLEISDWFAWYQ